MTSDQPGPEPAATHDQQNQDAETVTSAAESNADASDSPDAKNREAETAAPEGKWPMIALIAFGLLALLGAAYGTLTAQKIESSDPLTVDSRRLNFGEVWAQDNFTWTMPVRNESAKPIHIAAFQSS